MNKATKMAAIATLLIAVTAVPTALAATDSMEQLQEQLRQIESKYGFPVPPELTDSQWDEYDAEWQKIEEQKKPYYDELDKLDSEYDKVWDKIDAIDVQGNAINEKFGISNEHPVLSDQQWDQYQSEAQPIWDKMDAYYAENGEQNDTAFQSILDEFGITEPVNDTSGFFDDLGDVGDWYTTVHVVLENPDMAQQEKEQLYTSLAERAPEIQTVYEKHGFKFPVSTAEQFESLIGKLVELEKTDE